MENEFLNIDWTKVLSHLAHIGIAFVLALPVAWNREHTERGAGLRTFPLVSIAACGYMLVGIEVFESNEAEARVMYGLITGMGFIGGGAILKGEHTVTGTATATSIWNTGAIGISVAFARYEIAILLSLINYIVLQFFTRLKHHDDH